jgi:osmotically inducible lipoprotein OsmB
MNRTRPGSRSIQLRGPTSRLMNKRDDQTAVIGHGDGPEGHIPEHHIFTIKKKGHVMLRLFTTTLLVAGLGVAIAGCGRTEGQRAVSGGLIGAGAGAGIAAIAGGPVLGAALLGGAVGAGTGALTTPNRR